MSASGSRPTKGRCGLPPHEARCRGRARPCRSSEVRRVHLDAHRATLAAGAADRQRRGQRARQGRPAARGTRTRARTPGSSASCSGASTGTGPRISASARSSRDSRVSTASRGPVTEAIRTAGGRASSTRSASSREAYPEGSQRTSACVTRSSASPTSTTGPARGGRTHEGCGREPAAQRVLPRSQGRPGGADGRVQQQSGGVPARRDRLRARRRDDDRRRVGDDGQHAAGRPGAGDADRHPGNARPELLGRPLRADADGPQRPGAALGAPPVGGQPPAPAAGGDAVAPWSDPAGRGTRRSAPPPGSARTRPRARTPRAGTCTRTGPSANRSRSVRHAGAGSLAAAAGPLPGELDRRQRQHPRRPGTRRRAVRDDLARPARLDQGLRLDAAAVRGHQQRALLELGPQGQHLADVRVRCSRLGVQRVPVVPHHGEPEVGHRRERRGARPRRPRSPGHAAPRGTTGSAPAGPSSAARRTAPPVDPGVQRGTPAASSAASTRSMSRASGTTTSAPRPPSTQAATACAIASGQRSPASPGRADHTALGAPPAVTCCRNAAPPRYGAHAVADGDGVGGSSDGAGTSASTRACRAGIARRSTSFIVPAHRSATARASLATCGVSTGSVETTLRTGWSAPSCSASSTRSST